ncbi:MAG: hypothetical protein WCO21_01190 [bacterium]
MNFENFQNQPPNKVEMSSKTIERTPPAPGGTLVIMQRHGNYDRATGHLTSEGKVDALARSHEIIEDILKQIPDEERASVRVLVVASPTIKNEGQRSMETASAVIESVKTTFEQYGIPAENLLTESPRPVEAIEEPRMLKDDSGFKQFLEDKYGAGSVEFWKAYEEEKHKEERERMGAEGPIEMSDRFAHFTNVLARYARLFHSKHKQNPERLIIWNVSHYDTITTFFKNHIADISQNENVPVDYDGGMSLIISPEGQASVKIDGTTYPMELTTSGTTIKRQDHVENGEA